jgi:hypothetical protein
VDFLALLLAFLAAGASTGHALLPALLGQRGSASPRVGLILFDPGFHRRRIAPAPEGNLL